MADNLLITGYWGEPHVTAENDRGFNSAVFGPGRFVLPVGEQFRAEYIGNNTVRVHDGKLITGGAVGGIPAGKYIDLLIPETGQGMKRNDLIVFQYSKDVSTLIETGNIVVVPGIETNGTPADPALTQQDLLTDEATFDQMALYRVSVSGANISNPEPLFDLALSLADVAPISNNLLDNSNWEHCVNQRGETSYRGLGYGIDRWIVPNTTSALTVGDGFVLIQNDATSGAAMFTQRLIPGTLKVGKTYTAAIYLNDDTVICGSGVLASGGTTLTNSAKEVYATIAPSTNYDVFRLAVNPAKYARVKWVALYEGEYTAKTLPKYQAKGYGLELAECQRYYQKASSDAFAVGHFCFGSNFVYVPLAFSYPMRSGLDIPTVSGSVDVCGDTGWLGAQNPDSVLSTISGFVVRVPIASESTFTRGKSYLVKGTIELSADL